MSRIFLGLGSNLGDRIQNISAGAVALRDLLGPNNFQISPLYETPALVPEHARSDWNKSYLNLVIQAECHESPRWLLEKTKAIESSLGRKGSPTWAPRTLDIDILYWDNVTIVDLDLQIPHRYLTTRSFVLDPLKDLAPRLKPILNLDQNVLQLARKNSGHTPLWMAILNVTPDSFSDGGQFVDLSTIEQYLRTIETSVGIIDVGAESTRPNATPLTWRQEWARLEPVLKFMHQRYSHLMIKPQISVDTRHAEVAKRSLDLGVRIINDVSGTGATSPMMLELLKHSTCHYVLTHSLTVPADPKNILSKSRASLDELKEWFKTNLNLFEKNGVSPERVILDPGIGFGKDSLQSLYILRHIQGVLDFSCRVLVGHSRKSFIQNISPSQDPADRDMESVGFSIGLAKKGVDILRVHNPLAHSRAFHGFNHLADEFFSPPTI